MPLLWCVGNACSFIMPGIESHTLMSQWNLNVKQQKYISLFLRVSVAKPGASTHEHELQGIQWFFFSFSLSLCLHGPVTSLTCADRDKLCGKWMGVW